MSKALGLLKPHKNSRDWGLSYSARLTFWKRNDNNSILRSWWNIVQISALFVFFFWSAWQSWVVWLPSHPHNLWSAHYVSMLISVSIYYWLSGTTIYRLHVKLQKWQCWCTVKHKEVKSSSNENIKKKKNFKKDV